MPLSCAQREIIVALRSAQKDVQKMNATYNERRLYMVERLKAMDLLFIRNHGGVLHFFVMHVSSPKQLQVFF